MTLLNKYSRALPGSNDDQLYDEIGIKYVFFNMMLEPWKIAFACTTNELFNNSYTIQQLVRYMTTQETLYNRSRRGANNNNNILCSMTPRRIPGRYSTPRHNNGGNRNNWNNFSPRHWTPYHTPGYSNNSGGSQSQSAPH